MKNAIAIVFVGLMVFISHLFTGIFYRRKIPDVLLLMAVGIILGPVLKLISPEDFGKVGPIFTTITLVIILFEGGLTLRFDTLKNAIRGTSALTTTNFFVTMCTVGLIGWLIFRLNPVAAFMLGAILGGTSSAVVIPMVQQLRIREETKTILVLESAISDVLCIVFALALLETFQVEDVKIALIAWRIVSSFVFAAVIGWIGAMAWSILLNRVRTIRNSLFTTPAFVFIIYGVTEMFGFSGAIAALAFGITLANIELFNFSFIKKHASKSPISLNEAERIFFSEIVFLLKTFFFIYIGLSIQFYNPWSLLLGLLLTIVIYIIRMPITKISIRKPLPTSDLTTISIMVPKGLAAAVLASLPLQQGVEGGEFIRDITYAVILFSIIFTSVLVPLVEKSSTVRGIYGLFLRKGFIFRKRKK
ncbi:MAG TPA: cation:proton antiporter [Perlabentimonas sp.]|nr:cation:proton antiporter [Perlabentimonas sp.]